MTIGIIGAMDEEIESLQETISCAHTVSIAGSLFIEGSLQGQDVVLVKSGIGKTNAAMTTTILMERYKPNFIINTGSAGGISERLQVGDIVISDKVVYHDVDVTGFNYKYGQVPGLPAVFSGDPAWIEQTKQILEQLDIGYEIGLIATGDAFMNDPNRIENLQREFPQLTAFEMEAAAIAQVCYQYDVPFVVIRALSDIAGKDAPMSFDAFIKVAAENAANVIIRLLQTNT